MCDDKMNSCGGNQGGCGGHHSCGAWGHRSLLRVLLALLILGFVFYAGVKFGMLKAYLGYGNWGYYRGFPAMMYSDGNAGYGVGMMQAWVESNKAITSTKK